MAAWGSLVTLVRVWHESLIDQGQGSPYIRGRNCVLGVKPSRMCQSRNNPALGTSCPTSGWERQLESCSRQAWECPLPCISGLRAGGCLGAEAVAETFWVSAGFRVRRGQ